MMVTSKHARQFVAKVEGSYEGRHDGQKADRNVITTGLLFHL